MHTVDTCPLFEQSGGVITVTVYHTSSHDGGVGLFVAQVDGLIDGQQFEAVIGGGKDHNAERFKPCRCMATQGITLTAIRCPNSPL